jgi:hypothetical protein
VTSNHTRDHPPSQRFVSLLFLQFHVHTLWYLFQCNSYLFTHSMLPWRLFTFTFTFTFTFVVFR